MYRAEHLTWCMKSVVMTEQLVDVLAWPIIENFCLIGLVAERCQSMLFMDLDWLSFSS